MGFPYGLTAEDLQARFSEQKLIDITDEVNDPPTTLNEELLEDAANDAAGELESYAGAYYQLPLQPLIGILRTNLLDLWAWRLLFNVKPDWLETERISDGFSWKDRRKELVKWMESLAAGSVSLPGVTPLSATSTTSGGAWSTGGTNVMTRKKLQELP